MYRSFANVQSASNLNIHGFLLQLERRTLDKRYGGRLPKTIFLQIDGGCENATGGILAICALIVAHRLCGVEEIILTRLPVGHTHEDIDARFGTLWKACRNQHLYTPQAYKAAMVEALSKKHGVRREVFRVIDLYAIPDYNLVLRHDKISNWTKLEDTQLQWRFQMVPRDKQHIYGVRTNYRYYSRDLVFVLRSIAEEDTGANVGYRPDLIEVTWQPGDDTDEFLEVLQGLPKGGIPPVGFYSGSAEDLRATIRQVAKLQRPVQAAWEEFASGAPTSDDAQQYLRDDARNNASSVALVGQWDTQLSEEEEMLDTQQLTLTRLRLHIPFKSTLFKSCTVDTDTDIAPIVKKPREENQKQQKWVEKQGLPFTFDGKPMQISKTQASVQHAGNKSRNTLRLGPTVITAHSYNDIEALPETERRAEWLKLVRNIGTYQTVSQHTLSLLLARVTSADADAVPPPKSKAIAWKSVHDAVGLVAPVIVSNRKKKVKIESVELKHVSVELKSEESKKESKSESKKSKKVIESKATEGDIKSSVVVDKKRKKAAKADLSPVAIVDYNIIERSSKKQRKG